MFTGGIVLSLQSLTDSNHTEGGIHDVFCEFAGAVCVDMHHSFVQRWNEAHECKLPNGHYPSISIANDLPFPVEMPKFKGNSLCQILRTTRAGYYLNTQSPVGASPFNIKDGEDSIFQQYKLAITAAKKFIYVWFSMRKCFSYLSRSKVNTLPM